MRYFPVIVAVACGLAVSCTPPPAAPPPAAPEMSSPAVDTALTCTRLEATLNSGDSKSGGFEILWLEGNYSGRTKTSAIPVGWIKTVAQAIGGNCAMALNASRTVIDVVGQVHRDYLGTTVRTAPRTAAASEDTSPAIDTAVTCGQLGDMFGSGDKRGGGLTIAWLEGYYSGRTGISAVPANWIKTVGDGIGTNCAMDANRSRPVIDIIAQVHREYGPAAGVR